MKTLTIDAETIQRIVSSRQMQSVEFEQGKTLAAVITGQAHSAKIAPEICVTHRLGHVFLTGTPIQADTKFLVIDAEQAEAFTGLTDANALFAFQKLARFTKKSWEGLSLNFSEMLVAGTTKAVIFPFPGYLPKPFRFVLERDPMPDRLKKRGQQGRFLLVYKAGTESGDANREEASLTNFRKVLDQVTDLRATPPAPPIKVETQPSQSNPLLVSELSEQSYSNIGSLRRFEDWQPLLTEQQKKFVGSGISGAHRIEGAAGTGKTLSLILKAIFELRRASAEKKSCNIAFITHSHATKEAISQAFRVMDTQHFQDLDRKIDRQSLSIRTLFELCSEQLRHSISETEFIDRDALESKETQLLYIDDALAAAKKSDLESHARFMSKELIEVIKNEDAWKVVQMLQHEISVSIKGRASENIDEYKRVPPLKYGIPTKNEADKGFVYTIFRYYEDALGKIGSFDNDDIVLSTTGQLDTPIWRRRRVNDGFDAIFIDETHLFNINELHLFHYFTKRDVSHPIIYSVDRSQAVGDRGWTTEDIENSIEDKFSSSTAAESDRFKTIFRSSPDIVNLAFSIVSSGATLFTNFDNPSDATSSAFNEEDERKASTPTYFHCTNDETMLNRAFSHAEDICRSLDCSRSEVLITTLDDRIFKKLMEIVTQRNKPVTVLKKRGDLMSVRSASQAGHLVLGHVDYVGGLEFQGVVIVGVDDGRVPPSANGDAEASKNFLSYSAHNRLYVAVSRAKYRVDLLGDKARGPSKLLASAIESKLLLTE
ncbi:UvrD-helicase domain-containing protein [Maricaulis sp.]|uniref:UvrD-helicase domain-containing protein n=1 Tax=Maricaulis sp. TaxID=1486257 RepID=UPI003299B49E